MGQAKVRGVLEWEQFDISEYELLVRNTQNNTWIKKQNTFFNNLVEEHVGVIYGEQELAKDKQVFEFRTKTPYVVHGLHFSYTQLNDVCSCHYKKSLFVEKIYLRLSDLSDIPIGDAIYMMIASLSGFQKLFDNFGPFRVTQEMIGIDENMHVKVWWSGDFGSTSPDHFVAVYSQRELANSVIGMVWKQVYRRTDIEQSPLEYILRNHAKHIGIGQILFMLGQYLVQHQISCPDRFLSAEKFIKQLRFQTPKMSRLLRSARSLDRHEAATTRLLSPKPQLTNRVTQKPVKEPTIQFAKAQALTDRSNNLFPKYKFMRKSSKKDETLEFSSSKISKNPEDSPIGKIQSVIEPALPPSLSLSALLLKLDNQY